MVKPRSPMARREARMKLRPLPLVLVVLLVTASAHADETITYSPPVRRAPSSPSQPVVVHAPAAERLEAGDAFPSDLPGSLIVFDLRRLDLYRANPDGTRLQRIHVNMSDSESRALNAAGVGAATASGATVATYAAVAANVPRKPFIASLFSTTRSTTIVPPVDGNVT